MFTAPLVLGDGCKEEILAETIEEYEEETDWEDGETYEQFLLRSFRTLIVNIIPRRYIGQIQIL